MPTTMPRGKNSITATSRPPMITSAYWLPWEDERIVQPVQRIGAEDHRQQLVAAADRDPDHRQRRLQQAHLGRRDVVAPLDVEQARDARQHGRQHEGRPLPEADVVAQDLGAQRVLADREQNLAPGRVDQHPAAEIADQHQDQHVVEEREAEEDVAAELEGRDPGHAVVAAELDAADPPLIARRLAEERFQQQRQHQGQDRHDPHLDARVEDEVAEHRGHHGRRREAGERAGERPPGHARPGCRRRCRRCSRRCRNRRPGRSSARRNSPTAGRAPSAIGMFKR